SGVNLAGESSRRNRETLAVQPPVIRGISQADDSLSASKMGSGSAELLPFTLSGSQLEIQSPGFDEGADRDIRETEQQGPAAPIMPPVMTSPPGAALVEQRAQGAQPSA